MFIAVFLLSFLLVLIIIEHKQQQDLPVLEEVNLIGNPIQVQMSEAGDWRVHVVKLLPQIKKLTAYRSMYAHTDTHTHSHCLLLLLLVGGGLLFVVVVVVCLFAWRVCLAFLFMCACINVSMCVYVCTSLMSCLYLCVLGCGARGGCRSVTLYLSCWFVCRSIRPCVRLCVSAPRKLLGNSGLIV